MSSAEWYHGGKAYVHHVNVLGHVCRSPFYYKGLTLITAISIYIHYKVWDENSYPFPNSTVQPLKFRDG